MRFWIVFKITEPSVRKFAVARKIEKVYGETYNSYFANFWFIIFNHFLMVKCMVKLKFIPYQGVLVLRFSEKKKRIYRSAKSVLIGRPNLVLHWDKDKERFTRAAVNAKANNDALAAFKAKYELVLLSNPNISLVEIATYYDPKKSPDEYDPSKLKDVPDDSFAKFVEKIVEREKVKSGCNFENYAKFLKKARKIVPKFDYITFSQIDYDKCVEIAGYFAKHKGYMHSMKTFRNAMGKAAKDRSTGFSIDQISGFQYRDYNPEKDVVKDHTPDVLTPEQVKLFSELNLDLVTPEFVNRQKVRLYYDFSMFMLHSMMSPCDVMKLRLSNVTKNHTLKTKRKKTHDFVEVPITPVLDEIITRYSGKSNSGYILPIVDDYKDAKSCVRDYSIKTFRTHLNVWLKSIGRELRIGFPLYAYVFRHTAITIAIDNGLPVPYVAAVAGTSIEIIQKHYYNPGNKQNAQRLQTALLKASGVI